MASEAFDGSAGTFSKLKPYWSLLEDAANSGNVALLKRLAPVEPYYQELRVLRLRLSDSSRVLVGGTTLLDLTKVKEVQLVRPAVPLVENRRRGHETLVVLWQDKDGHEQKGILTSLRGRDFGVSFAGYLAPP